MARLARSPDLEDGDHPIERGRPAARALDDGR